MQDILSKLGNISTDWRDTSHFITEDWYQKEEDGFAFTETINGKKRSKIFTLEQYTCEKRLFPAKSNLQSLVPECVYLFFPLHRVCTMGFNIFCGMQHAGLAGKHYFFQKKPRSLAEAAIYTLNQSSLKSHTQLAKKALKRALAQSISLPIPALLLYWQPTILGINLSKALFTAYAVHWICYSFLHPKMMKVRIADLEGFTNTKPLNDCQVMQLTAKERVYKMLTGEIPLSRILGIHQVGWSNELVAGNVEKWIKVN